MNSSFVDRHCANCAFKFRNAGQIFKKITIVEEFTNLKAREISILDAVLYIYGLSASNLASASLDDAKTTQTNESSFYKISETRDYISTHGLALCGNCVSVFKEVYVAFYGLKTLSNKASILSKTIKKFSPTFIKVENEGEIEDTARKSSRVSSTVHWRKTIPESYAEETDDLFQEFNFESHCEIYENEERDIKPDPVCYTGFENALDVVETVDDEPEEDFRKQKKRKCRDDTEFIPNFVSKTKKKVSNDNLPVTRNFTFIKSERGRDILVDEDKNTYECSKLGINGKRIWRCTKYSSDKCKGRCHTIGDEMTIIAPHTHIHSESARDLQMREFKNERKSLASSKAKSAKKRVDSEQDSIAATDANAIKTFTLIKSERGRDLLVDEDKYIYEFAKQGSGGKKIWRCTKHRSHKCKGRCHAIGDEMKIIAPHTHDHLETVQEFQKRKFKNKIKDLASKTSNTPGEIIASALQEKDSIAPEVNIPKPKGLISSIYYARKKCKVTPNPDSSNDLVTSPQSEQN